MIPISRVEVPDDASDLVLEVLQSGQLAAGPLVERFEEEFARLIQVEHAVAVSSGTAALVAALQVIGLEPGDEVITTPFTFVATLNAILASGATARFADVGQDFNMDASRLADVMSDRTRVILPVHLYGQPADLADIVDLASAAGATVVEDAAQAVGASYEDQPVGSFGIGCFSLYATKNVTTGEGGVVTCNDGEIARRLRLLRNQGMSERYKYESVGFNYRMTDIQAAIGIPQLAMLDELIQRRTENAEALTTGLSGIPGIILPSIAPTRTHVFHQYTIRVTPGAKLTRDELSARLRGHGIETGIYYPDAVHAHSCFAEHPQVVVDDTPMAELLAKEVLSLPVHPSLSTADIALINQAMHELLG